MTTEPATSDDDDDFDSPMTMTDWVEIITDDLEQAAEGLDRWDVGQLCRAIQRKIEDILTEPVDDEDGDDDADLPF
jgi:hypothetical protein